MTITTKVYKRKGIFVNDKINLDHPDEEFIELLLMGELLLKLKI